MFQTQFYNYFVFIVTPIKWISSSEKQPKIARMTKHILFVFNSRARSFTELAINFTR